MKRFILLLVTAVLIVSMFGVMTVFAGASISGNSKVYAGSSYTYTGKASYTGLDLVAKIEGLGEAKSFDKNSGSPNNASLSGNASIKVKIPSSATPGTKYTITLSGQYSVKQEDGSKVKKTFSTSKTITVVEKTSSGSTNNTVKTAAPTEWDIAATNVQAMQAGGAITVDVTDDPNIPASLLSSVKEKMGTLSVNFGSYACAIDGKSLGSIPEDVKTIDLSMKTDKDESLSAAAGGKDAYQLHFAHSGQLPGKLSYTFKAENNKPGDALYLYYYYSQPGVCEGVQLAVVDSNGYVTFDIYHCSSYFVSAETIEGAAGINFAAGTEESLALREAEESLAEAEESRAQLQAQLEDAQNSLEKLQAEIDTHRSDAAPEENPLTAQVFGPVENLFGVPYGSLIAALLGAALAAMFLTMLICRVGIFKKKERTDI